MYSTSKSPQDIFPAQQSRNLGLKENGENWDAINNGNDIGDSSFGGRRLCSLSFPMSRTLHWMDINSLRLKNIFSIENIIFARHMPMKQAFGMYMILMIMGLVLL